MREFSGKVAVVTGAASGIGRALAERCVQEGMRVVLADIEEGALRRTEAELRSLGAEVLAVRIDVSKAGDVEMLAQRTLEHFGKVHLLFNNAGVLTSLFANVWESSVADWQWMLGVNLWGAIHGVRVFVPLMLAQGEEGHIVNTASVAGLIPGFSVYGVTKHAVVALSEALESQLGERTKQIGVSVLCPGFVNTKILEAARNRPRELQDAAEMSDADVEAESPATPQSFEMGMAPAVVAQQVFAAIQEKRLYILTHPEENAWIRARAERILEA